MAGLASSVKLTDWPIWHALAALDNVAAGTRLAWVETDDGPV